MRHNKKPTIKSNRSISHLSRLLRTKIAWLLALSVFAVATYSLTRFLYSPVSVNQVATTKSNPFAGAKLSGGTTEKPTTVEKVIKAVTTPKEKQSLGPTTTAPKNTTTESVTKPKPKYEAEEESDDSNNNDNAKKDNPFEGSYVNAGAVGTDKEGNKIETTVVRDQNELGGVTTVTTNKKTDVDTGNSVTTITASKKDKNDRPIAEESITFETSKNKDGSANVKVTNETTSQEIISNKVEAAKINGAPKVSSSGPVTRPSGATNPNKLCKAGNVTVAAGTWVATGFNMGDDRSSERECVQINDDCTHGQTKACHEAYSANPTTVVLPNSVGPEYTQGVAYSDPKYSEIKVQRNCISNGETVPSGNERTDVGICYDGSWKTKAEYDAILLREFAANKATNQGTGCVPGSHNIDGKAIWVTCDDNKVVGIRQCTAGNFDSSGNCVVAPLAQGMSADANLPSQSTWGYITSVPDAGIIDNVVGFGGGLTAAALASPLCLAAGVVTLPVGPFVVGACEIAAFTAGSVVGNKAADISIDQARAYAPAGTNALVSTSDAAGQTINKTINNLPGGVVVGAPQLGGYVVSNVAATIANASPRVKTALAGCLAMGSVGTLVFPGAGTAIGCIAGAYSGYGYGSTLEKKDNGEPPESSSLLPPDTGQAQISSVSAPQPAGQPGGFNLSEQPDDRVITISDRANSSSKIRYYNQNNYANRTTRDGSSWGDVGCGIMAGAMVMSTTNSEFNPDQYYSLLERRGGVNSKGTGWFDQHKLILEENNYSIVPLTGSTSQILHQIDKYAQNDIPVWISAYIDNGQGNYIGHHTIAVGTDGNAIILNDPEYGQGYRMPIDRLDINCSESNCPNGTTNWVVNAIIPPEN